MLFSPKATSKLCAPAVLLATILSSPATPQAATPFADASARAATAAASRNRSGEPSRDGISQIAATQTPGANGVWVHFPPPNLQETGAAYDRARNRLLLFGGRDGRGASNDLWALGLDGAHAWSQLPTVGARPAGRSAHNLVYDPVHDSVWLFGGSDTSNTVFGDVWTLALGVSPLTWTQASPAGPTP